MKFKLLVNWKLKTSLLTLLCVISFSAIQAQTVTIKGTVKGDGQSLPGVSVIVKGTKNGTVTDFDGKFEVKAKATDALVFSYMGFATQQVSIGGRTSMNVTLVSDVSALNEVVVVGYGTQKKKEVTGAVSQLKSEDLMKTATSDLGAALQGQIAGVTVTASSGEPGSESNVMIRGLTSIDGGNRPLYVVDGIPYDGDPKLSMNEIETIDVLKDAASAAIYGTRGASGVILITTKKGKIGQMKVSVESYYGVQNITSGTPLQNVEERLYTTFLSSQMLNDRYFGNTWTTVEQNPITLTNNTVLTDILLNDMAPIQNHNLTVSGGKDGLAYNITANYFGQQGILFKSNYDKFNVRANTQFTKGKWKISTGLSFRTEDKDNSPWGILLDAIKYNPLQTAIDPDSDQLSDAGEGSGASNLSYLGYKLLGTDNEITNYFDGSINAEYSFSKNLKFTSRLATSYDNSLRIAINPPYTAYDINGDLVPSQTSKIRNTSSLGRKSTWENILNYNKKVGNHSFNGTLVYSYENFKYSQFYAEKSDIFRSDITVLNGASGEAQVGSGTNRWTQDRDTYIFGSLLRGQYNYKGKYLVSASVRRDGSSRFKEDAWGIFPGFSLGWNVSDENFWEPIKDVASSLKVRASYGTVGNQNIGDYTYDALIALENDYVFGNGDDETLNIGAIQTEFANPNVGWETSISRNFGFDLGLFNEKLTIAADVYKTNKENMLFPVLLPSASGAGIGGDVTLNVSDMVNQGYEFAINYKHSGKISGNMGFTFTHNENEITKMVGAKTIYFGDSSISGHDNDSDNVSTIAEGYEGGAFFLWENYGVIKNQDDLLAYQAFDPTAKIGDMRYVDQLTVDTDNDGVADAGDGFLDVNDRKYAGSGTPDFEIGYNYSANYKNFDFSMQWYGSFGAEIINGSKALAYKIGSHKDLIYQWTPQNTDSDIPTNRGATHYNYRGASDYWVEDGSFVRLRNVSLGYTLPKKFIQKINLNRLRVYISGQNLLTITKYDGYDPEVGNNGLSTRGIDKGTYPISTQMRVGLQLEF